MSGGKFSTIVTRGKTALARIAARTLLQVTALDQETFNNIELLLPPGYVANPKPGGDVLLLEANGLRGHVVAICGDSTADTVATLQPGELGLATNGKSVLLLSASVTVKDPQAIILQAPVLQWTPDGVTFYTLATSTHTHDVSGEVTDVPNSVPGMLT